MAIKRKTNSFQITTSLARGLCFLFSDGRWDVSYSYINNVLVVPGDRGLEVRPSASLATYYITPSREIVGGRSFVAIRGLLMYIAKGIQTNIWINLGKFYMNMIMFP